MQKIHNPKNEIILEKIKKLYEKNKKSDYITQKIINEIDTIIQDNEYSQKELIKILKKSLITENQSTSILDGLIFSRLIEIKTKYIRIELKKFFPNGIINLQSSSEINYQPLQDLLINKNFQEADKLTQKILCKLTPLNKNKQRNWLYFTDISLIPSNDLLIIDLLWTTYSYGKFGFSIQRKIWQKQNKDWNKFLNQVGWIQNGKMRRYPQEFIWTINAPKGHLPLFNQLRGIQVIDYLFKHVAWLQ